MYNLGVEVATSGVSGFTIHGSFFVSTKCGPTTAFFASASVPDIRAQAVPPPRENASGSGIPTTIRQAPRAARRIVEKACKHYINIQSHLQSNKKHEKLRKRNPDTHIRARSWGDPQYVYPAVSTCQIREITKTGARFE